MSDDLERSFERAARAPSHPLDVGALPRRATRLKLGRLVAAGTAVMVVGGGGVFAVANWDRGPRSDIPVVAPGDDRCGPLDFNIAIYLRDDITDGERGRVEARITGWEGVDPESVEYFSKADAYREFKDFYRDQPEYWENLPKDALPAWFRFAWADSAEPDEERVKREFETMPGVDGVRTGESLERSRRETCDRRQPTRPPPDDRVYARSLEYGLQYQPQVFFTPTQSWYVTQTEPPQPIGGEGGNWGWASNNPLRGNIDANPHPAAALRKLPDDGIFITASANRWSIMTPAERSRIPRVVLPFDISNAAVSHSYEGQVRETQPMYSLFGRVGEHVVQVNVVFGASPTDRMLNEAQFQLDHMHVRPGLREIGYNGTPLPEPVETHEMDIATIEIPVEWELREATTQPPSEFIITSYDYRGTTTSCDNGLFGQMPEDGVAIVGFPNGPFDETQPMGDLYLDPSTYLNYEGLGCLPSYKIDVGEGGAATSLHVFFGSDTPSDRTLALTLRTLDSLRLP